LSRCDSYLPARPPEGVRERGNAGVQVPRIAITGSCSVASPETRRALLRSISLREICPSFGSRYLTHQNVFGPLPAISRNENDGFVMIRCGAEFTRISFRYAGFTGPRKGMKRLGGRSQLKDESPLYGAVGWASPHPRIPALSRAGGGPALPQGHRAEQPSPLSDPRHTHQTDSRLDPITLTQ
jgi:hypothetical protein